MNKDMLQKWIPLEDLGASYDVENISWGADGISFTLVSPDKQTTQDHIHRFRLTWDSSQIISYLTVLVNIEPEIRITQIFFKVTHL